MTAPREVVPGRDLLITRSVTQQEMLLRPDKEATAIYTYCLCEAAALFNITLYGWIAMSNHEHLAIRDNEGNHPEFLERFHRMVAKALNRLRGRSENFWASEQPNVVYLVEKDDAFEKLVYALANPVASDLVDRASDWPGASSLRLNLSGGELTVQRPRGYFRANGPTPNEVTVRVERIPGFEKLSAEEWHDKLFDAVQLVEERARTARRSKGRGIVGRKEVQVISPRSRPSSVRARGGLRPSIACQNAQRRSQEILALRGFRAAHRAARERWCAGDHTAAFPFGTYKMLKLGARCEARSGPPPALTAS